MAYGWALPRYCPRHVAAWARHAWLKSAPWAVSKWLARMRSMGPRLGTLLLSRTPLWSFRKLTLACRREMSPVASALPCARSRHHAAEVTALDPSVGEGSGSWARNATLKNPAGSGLVPAPPGWLASAL